jgi:hypothetical protein
MDLVPLGEHAVKGRAAVRVFGWRPPTQEAPAPRGG